MKSLFWWLVMFETLISGVAVDRSIVYPTADVCGRRLPCDSGAKLQGCGSAEGSEHTPCRS
jgi:hypothetical protein